MLNDLPDETKNMYKSKEENQILVLLSPNHFLKMAWLHKQKMKGIYTENIYETFDSFITRVLDKQPLRAATLAVIGLDTYTREKGLYSPVKRPKNSEKESIEDSESWVSRELGLTCADLDEVQVALQLQTHTTVWFLENWQQFADHIATLTKAIARSPFKKQTEKMTFSFCPDGTWSTGVKVDKDGKGLLKLWKKQLQQLNRITQPVAMAIAQAYPTPKLLLRAYRQCSTEWEKQNLLSEVKVYAAGKRVDRRVGPDISRRLYIFMTSENSDIVLDKSG
ncbi:crossover junction endonuclease EME1 [Hemiscyllium ocellatum]|uniref:crossover junction endonuclease EME1 n=1 Tax=Hemiscyllium ocellatum TaxID=170820 RepID=UPI002966E835|nr:crossover junction endonuclease EME1 [Hemiscyllium ocellatum]